MFTRSKIELGTFVEIDTRNLTKFFAKIDQKLKNEGKCAQFSLCKRFQATQIS